MKNAFGRQNKKTHSTVAPMMAPGARAISMLLATNGAKEV